VSGRRLFSVGTHVACLATDQPADTLRDIEFRHGGEGAPFRAASLVPVGPDRALLLLRRDGNEPLFIRAANQAWQPVGEAQPLGLLAEFLASVPRTLGLIASKATGTLRTAADPAFLRDFGALCRALAVPAPEGARPLVGLAMGRALWRLDQGGWLLTAHGVTRLAEPEAGLLPLPPLPRGGLLLRGDAQPWLLPAATATLPSLVELARQGGNQGAGAQPGLLRQCFMALRRYTAEPWCHDSLRDAQVLAMAPARAATEPSNAVAGAVDRALSDHGGGIFLTGWLHDPLKLVRGMALRGPFGPVPIPPGTMFPCTRTDIAKRFEAGPFGNPGPRPGFAAHIPDAGPGPVAQWRLGITLGSGDTIELVAGSALLPPAQAREAVLRSVNPLDVGPLMLDTCIAPAAARLHKAASAEPLDTEVVQIGTPVECPICSVVIPLYRNLRFMRHQVAAFARDPMLRDSEIIMVLDSPEQRGEAEHMLRGICGLTGLPVTLVVHGRNAGYATACNSGAALARAPMLLQLNSDVIPDRPGWMAPLFARLASDPRIGCVGPKLMFDDGSLQHAGLYFARGPLDDWYNCHYFKGFPRYYPDANRPRRSPGVTGAAMFMPRRAWDEVGGFHADYIVGDYEDSDLCLRLRQAGFDIWYEPAAELFHFERQSIAQHAGYSGTVAAAYNRRLHHRRWSEAIARLMEGFPGTGATNAAA
jgi:GT2 family glycosyltransferase